MGTDVTFGAQTTPRMERVLARARVEAGSLGHTWVGVEHLLIALAAEDEGVAARVLGDLGVGADDVRARVVAVYGGRPVEVAHKAGWRARLRSAWRRKP